MQTQGLRRPQATRALSRYRSEGATLPGRKNTNDKDKNE